LFAVNWINNRDKHRLVHTVAAVAGLTRARLAFNPGIPADKIVRSEFSNAPFAEDGAQVFRLDLVDPIPNVDVDLDIALQIFIRDVSTTQDIRELLLEAGQHVQRIVANVASKDLPREPISHLT
jgi:hypothetical protein